MSDQFIYSNEDSDVFVEPLARKKVCERVWFDLDEHQRTLLQYFHSASEFDSVVYANEATLNRMCAEMQQMILRATAGNQEYLKVFWNDKMMDAVNTHRKKLEAEV